MRTFTYTGDQTAALEEMYDWAETDELFFKLRGWAGTGKSTISKSFLDGLYEVNNRLARAIVVSAPTHKAKRIIGDKTGRSACTIHSLVGIRPNLDLEDFDPAKPAFASVEDEITMNNYTIVLIDESSMLNDNLTDLIKDLATRYNTRVVFVGDLLQLPPVKNGENGTYKPSKSLLPGDGVPDYELVELVRVGEENPLVEVLTALRQDMLNGTYTFIDILNRDHDRFISIQGEECGYRCFRDVNELFRASTGYYTDAMGQTDVCKYLAWTNDNIKQWNTAVRKVIYGESVSPLIEGEILMAYKSITYNNLIPLVFNSSDYLVTEVMEDEVYAVIPGETDPDLEGNIEGYTIKLADTFDNRTVDRPLFIVKPGQYDLFMRIHDKLKNDAVKARGWQRGTAWKKYYTFRHSHLVMDTLKKKGRRKPETYKDLDYNYGVTVHKSQGSTYETVIINGRNITKNPEPREMLRLWYVALSRASKRCLILLP